MASTKDKVQKVLSENRNLVLGAQIFLGFQYQAVFRPGFDRLSEAAKALEGVTLALLLVTIACLIAPSSFHRLSEGGEATRRQLAYSKAMIGIALVPFALAIGSNVDIVTTNFLGTVPAALLGIAATGAALFLWFGIALMNRKPPPAEEESDEQVPLKEKINELLTESRIVLPGAQALLGFQLAAFLTDGFEKLPRSSQAVHLASTLAIALAMIILMTPAPFHRIAEHGENTERFDRLAVALVLAALVPLSLGLAGDLYVVLAKISGNIRFSIACAIMTVVGALALWFGVPLLARGRSAMKPARSQAC